MAGLRTRVAALAAAGLILAAGAAWYLGSPAWTLHQMKAAAEADDPDALNSYIDYPALRAHLKAEIMAQMTAEANKDRSGLGGLGLALGTRMVGPVIDGVVTPAAMRAAFTAKRDQARAEVAAGAASALRLPDDPVIERRGLSEFLVASKRQPRRGLLFKRHGLWWKLSGVALPPNG